MSWHEAMTEDRIGAWAHLDENGMRRSLEDFERSAIGGSRGRMRGGE
jgi:hypothetical protein